MCMNSYYACNSSVCFCSIGHEMVKFRKFSNPSSYYKCNSIIGGVQSTVFKGRAPQ